MDGRRDGPFRAVTRRSALALGAGAVAAAAVPDRARAAGLIDDGGGGISTVLRVIVRGAADGRGWRRHVVRPGEPHLVRGELADARPTRAARRTGVAAFVHLTDVHVQDTQSPARLEFIDAYRDRSGVPEFGGAYRPHDVLSAQVAASMIEAVNGLRTAPATGLPPAFAISTGDAADSCQYNELRRAIDLLDGGLVRPDSGLLGTYEGVGNAALDHGAAAYWHPEGGRDDYSRHHGFRPVPGLQVAALRAFPSAGLAMPWFAAHGNHEGLVRGGFSAADAFAALAVGGEKPVALPAGIGAPEFVDRLMQGETALLGRLRSETVTADDSRRLIDRREMVAEHFHTTGSPIGHGFTEANRAEGTAYYGADAPRSPGGSTRPLRLVVLDTVNEHGDGDGSLDLEQFAWLRRALAAEPDRLTVVCSHHTSDSLDNELAGRRRAPEPRVLGPEIVRLLLTHPQVVLWVNGHVHRNIVTAHRADGRPGGLWEVTTASHVDWPQQARAIELADNRDGTLSIFATVLDSAADAEWDGAIDSPRALSALSRELAANDPHRWDRPDVDDLRFRGARADRNVELLLPVPKGVVV